MPSLGFEPAIPAIELLQNYALDRTASGIHCFFICIDIPSGHRPPHLRKFRDHSQLDSPNSVGPLLENTAIVTTNKHTCRRRDSNPQSQQANCRHPTPKTARPLRLAPFYYSLYIQLLSQIQLSTGLPDVMFGPSPQRASLHTIC
jgi:hypothetical protein